MTFQLPKFKMGEEGFTLTEMLVAIAVSMVVLATVSGVFIVQNKTYATQEKVVVIQQSARAAMQLITKELLMAGYNPNPKPSDPDFFGIEIADLDTVQFTMDLDRNGSRDPEERIQYTLDTTLKRVTRKTDDDAAPVTVAENIQSLSFSYFDSNGNELTNLPLSDSDKAKVTRVSVQVTPITLDSSSLVYEENTIQDGVINFALAGITRTIDFAADKLVPTVYATNTRSLSDSVVPPNLRRTKTGPDDGYETAQDDTWDEIGSSSSSGSSS